MEEQEKIIFAALAGLLHDIGKFAMRAGIDGSAKNTGHQIHANLSGQFVDEFIPAKLNSQALAAMVSRHHTPEDDVGSRLHLADWLSAQEAAEEEDHLVSYLRSIFSVVWNHKKPYHLPLYRLDPANEQAIFPKPGDSPPWQSAHQKEYEALWEQFTQGCRAITAQTAVDYLESLHSLLAEYTWSIPTAYFAGLPDISLYDHARTTAAINSCLAWDDRSKDWCQKTMEAAQAGNDSDPVCRLVIGDISRVQEFIYTITSENAARSLRGRSFYLQLLTEVVADFILRELGLPVVNLLYAGGGRFELLVPVNCQKQLEEIKVEVGERLLFAHGGALSMALAEIPMLPGDFTHSTAGDELNLRLEQAKRRPFAELERNLLYNHWLGDPEDVGGSDFCRVCGSPFNLPPKKVNQQSHCELCKSFEDLGNILPRATHLLWYVIPANKLSNRVAQWQHGLSSFGADIRLIDERKSTAEECQAPKSASLARIFHFKPDGSAGGLTEWINGLPVISAYRLFAQLVAHGPGRGNYPLLFDEIAENSRGSLKRWAVLRMDADNMGKLFSQGIPGSPTLARTATLSSSLRLFFEGYLPEIGHTPGGADRSIINEYSAQKTGIDRVYIQYVGGDDLFIVGTWDALPEFSQRVRSAYQKYTCGNSQLTLSGGITIHDQRFPLYQAARQAEEAEKFAKDYQRFPNGPSKDALTFLNETLSWEDFSWVKDRAEALAGWCKQELVPRSLIHLLLSVDTEFQRGLKPYPRLRRIRQPRPYYGRWMWMQVYYLVRLAERVRRREAAEELVALESELRTGERPSMVIEQFAGSVLKDHARIPQLGMVARWAELLIR